MSAPQSNLSNWTIGQQHHPIRTGSPAIWSFRQGQGKPLGTVESVKAANEIYAPVSGEVVDVNAALKDAPEKI